MSLGKFDAVIHNAGVYQASSEEILAVNALAPISFLPHIVEGRINPGPVFDRTISLDGVRDGYRAMNDRESIKVLIEP